VLPKLRRCPFGHGLPTTNETNIKGNTTALEEHPEECVGEISAPGAGGGDGEDEAHATELESVLLAASLPNNEVDTNMAIVETNSPSMTTTEAEV
jgi:hypothetical protein